MRSWVAHGLRGAIALQLFGAAAISIAMAEAGGAPMRDYTVHDIWPALFLVSGAATTFIRAQLIRR